MRYLAVLLFLFVAACDYVEPTREVGGVNLDELFAPATATEIDAVQADWAARDVTPRSVRIEYLTSVTGEERTTQVMIVSHATDAGRHFGAILFPNGADPGSLPVFLYLHGGDAGTSVDDEGLPVAALFSGAAGDFVMVIPSFRDEPLRFDGRTWNSEGPASPWDRDVDDAMMLLGAALDLTPAADPGRIAAIGFSRGAGVALLLGARDDRIDRVVEFFGPTDFFGPFVQDVTEEILQGDPRDLPGLDFLSDEYLLPLSRGELGMTAVRRELVRRSAVLFVDAMPPVQLHHGTADPIVPVSQGQALIAAMQRAGKPASEFEGYLYEGGGHNPLTLDESIVRTLTFLEPLSNAP